MDHSYSTERERLQKVDHAYFSIGKKTPKVVLRKAQSNKEQQGERLLVDKDHSYHRTNPLHQSPSLAAKTKKPHLSLHKSVTTNKTKRKINSKKTSTVAKDEKCTVKANSSKNSTSQTPDTHGIETIMATHTKVHLIPDEQICIDNYSDHSYYKDSFSLLLDVIPHCSEASDNDRTSYKPTNLLPSLTSCKISDGKMKSNYDLSQLKISCSLDHAYFNGVSQLYQVSLSANQCSS